MIKKIQFFILFCGSLTAENYDSNSWQNYSSLDQYSQDWQHQGNTAYDSSQTDSQYYSSSYNNAYHENNSFTASMPQQYDGSAQYGYSQSIPQQNTGQYEQIAYNQDSYGYSANSPQQYGYSQSIPHNSGQYEQTAYNPMQYNESNAQQYNGQYETAYNQAPYGYGNSQYSPSQYGDRLVENTSQDGQNNWQYSQYGDRFVDSNPQQYSDDYRQSNNQGAYTYSSPYSSERFEGKSYPYNSEYFNNEQEMQGSQTYPMQPANGSYSIPNQEQLAPSGQSINAKQLNADRQISGYSAEKDPPFNGYRNWQKGEMMGTMPQGEEGIDPAKEYQEPSCSNLYYRYEPEYYNEWHCENETRYCHKRHCRYVPQYYQKRCCVYVPQYYYVTRVAYVPEYYYSAKRYEVPSYYSVPKFRYKKRYFYKSESQECQYLNPDDTECICGRP